MAVSQMKAFICYFLNIESNIIINMEVLPTTLEDVLANFYDSSPETIEVKPFTYAARVLEESWRFTKCFIIKFCSVSVYGRVAHI